MTGSVAILTEALHSAIDLVASIVAYVSRPQVRPAAGPRPPVRPREVREPRRGVRGRADPRRRGRHRLRVLQPARRGRPRSSSLGFGIGDHRADDRRQPRRLLVPGRRRARETDSPALEGDAAHLRTDAATSVAVLVGLALVEITGQTWLDPAVALAVAVAIVRGRRPAAHALVARCSSTTTLPDDELEIIRECVVAFGPRGVAGFHKLRARHAGASPPRRHARAVPRRDVARGRPRDGARAAGRDRGAAARARTC